MEQASCDRWASKGEELGHRERVSCGHLGESLDDLVDQTGQVGRSEDRASVGCLLDREDRDPELDDLVVEDLGEA